MMYQAESYHCFIMFKSVFDVWKHPMMLCIQRTYKELIDTLMYCVAAVLLFWPFLASWQIIEQTDIINWKATMMIIYIFSSVFTVCGRLMNFPVWVNIMFKDLSILQCLSLCRRERDSWGHQNISCYCVQRSF